MTLAQLTQAHTHTHTHKEHPMFNVITTVTGPTYYLRGRIWTSEPERATTYATMEDAKAALAKAAKFNPKAARKAQIIPAKE